MTQHGATNGPLFLENNQSTSNIWEAEAEGDDVHESRLILSLILWQRTPRRKGLEEKRKREYLNGTAKIKSTVNHAFQEKTYCVQVV